jgi:hypothetical protein
VTVELPPPRSPPPTICVPQCPDLKSQKPWLPLVSMCLIKSNYKLKSLVWIEFFTDFVILETWYELLDLKSQIWLLRWVWFLSWNNLGVTFKKEKLSFEHPI